jgi:hypothetical protein
VRVGGLPLVSQRGPGTCDYFLLPFNRLDMTTEGAWTPLAGKNYDDFLSRLGGEMKHYDGGKLNHGPLREALSARSKGRPTLHRTAW